MDNRRTNLLDDAIRRLTPRQQECLHRLLAGHSEKQIAANMNLSPHTVHAHVKAIYRGLKVSTRAELMAHFMPTRPSD